MSYSTYYYYYYHPRELARSRTEQWCFGNLFYLRAVHLTKLSVSQAMWFQMVVRAGNF